MTVHSVFMLVTVTCRTTVQRKQLDFLGDVILPNSDTKNLLLPAT